MQRAELLLVWAWAIAFAAVGAWSQLSGAPFPLPGLRKVAEAGGFSVALQVAAVVVAAGWLAFGSWHTRRRLLVFQVIAVALFFMGFIVVGVPLGLAFGCFAGIARSQAARKPA
jgi:hypothetical protein